MNKGLGIAVALLSVLFSSLHAAQAQQSGSLEKEILFYINQYRQQHHRAPLHLLSHISLEAQQHSQHMANKRISFGHQGFQNRIKKAYKPLSHCNGGAENVAYYKTNAKELVDAWVKSSGHRRNILGNYNITGIGIAYGKKGWAHFTQMFAHCDEEKRFT